MKLISKLLLTRLLFATVICSLLPVSFIQGQTISQAESTQEPQVWVESSYINVFRDDRKSDESRTGIEWVMAKNEFESAQICIRLPEEFTINQVVLSDLKNEDKIISKEHIHAQFVEYFLLPQNTASLNKVLAVRDGRDFYPDALSNEKGIDVKKDTTQPVWITLYIPKETTAGSYTGNVVLQTTKGEFSVPMSVEVNDVIVPDSNQANYEILMWQLIIGSGFSTSTATIHNEDPIVRHYKYERWTPQWWELLEDFAKQMKNHRLNVLFVQTVQLLLDGGTTLDENGVYDFNWSKFDEYIGFFMEKGVVKSLTGYMMTSSGSLVNLIRKNYAGQMVTGTTGINSADADNWFKQYIPALHAHLKEKGWLDIWVQNLRDEPSNGADREDYTQLMEYMQSYAPDMKTGDPHTTRTAGTFLIAENVDVLIPLSNLYGDNQSMYSKALTEGKKLWTYTCVVPGGNHLNRFIDKPVWQGRSLAWFNYTTDATGYLHWGLMSWYRPITDFANGDTSSIFPDPKNNKIKTSIRLAALRDGSEDYELLKILEKTDVDAAKRLSQKIAGSSNSYNKSPEDMNNIRNMLVRAAAGVPDAIPAMKSITLSTYDITVALGDVVRIEYEYAPVDTFFTEISIETDYKQVLDLYPTGHIEAKKTGQATVTFTSKKYPDVKATCLVSVVEKIEETTHETTHETTTSPAETTGTNEEPKEQNHNGILIILIAGAIIIGTVFTVAKRRK